jgi:hypothetical protein
LGVTLGLPTTTDIETGQFNDKRLLGQSEQVRDGHQSILHDQTAPAKGLAEAFH